MTDANTIAILVWGTGAFTIACIGGLLDDGTEDGSGFITAAVLGTMWPLILAVVIVSSPIWIGGLVGMGIKES